MTILKRLLGILLLFPVGLWVGVAAWLSMPVMILRGDDASTRFFEAITRPCVPAILLLEG